jgi:hypothetical protein
MGFNAEFSRAVMKQLERSLDLAKLQSGYVDYSQWPEFEVLDRAVAQAIQPLLTRLADQIATEAYGAFASQILFGAIVDHVGDVFKAREAGVPLRLPGDVDPPSDDGGKAA